MNIAQFLLLLAFGPHVEIIESLLPELRFVTVWPELRLGGRRAATAKQDSRRSLFDDFHDYGWVADFGFADQQMDVFRHDDVSDDDKTVAAAGLLQDTQEEVAAAWSV